MNGRTVLRALAALPIEVSILPAYLLFHFEKLIAGDSTASIGMSERASRWPGILGILRRRVLWGRVLSNFGVQVSIGFGTVLSTSAAQLGSRIYIGQHCSLGDIVIGDDTLISDHVIIPSGARQHGIERTDIPIRQQDGRQEQIRIGSGCWIGAHSVVLADIGDNSVVAAGSVVIRPVGAWQVVGGNPARLLRSRLSNINNGE